MRDAAGRADQQRGAPSSSTTVGAIDERGRLPPSTRFATGLPSASGVEGEVGQLVVEQEAVGHDPAAEAGLDARRRRDHVAVAVDDDEMRGAVLGPRLVGGVEAGPRPRAARRRVASASRGRDRSARAAGEIVRVEQAVGRHLDEVGVGHVEAAVREGEPRGLDEQVVGVQVRAGRARGRRPPACRGSGRPSAPPELGGPMPQTSATR